MRLACIVGCVIALSVGVGGAAAAPGFFTGAVDAPEVLAGSGPALADLGLGGARMWVEWNPEHSEPDAAAIASVEAAAAALPPGARLLVSVGSSVSSPQDPSSRDRYCGYVRALLEAVPSVRDIGIWNEPNKTAAWRPQFAGTDPGDASVAPAAYVALLARCWDVLHAFRPDVNIVAPSTSPSGNNRPHAVSNISHSPLRFIEEMGAAYRLSGRTKRIFDTVGHNAYGRDAAERPWWFHTDQTWISQGDWSRLMSAYAGAFGGTAQPRPGRCDAVGCVWIWYTEAGFQTQPVPAKAGAYSGTETAVVVPDDVGGDSGPPYPADAPDRRAQIVDAIRLAACQPYVQAFFNYLVRDEEPLNRWQSGFLWADGTMKTSSFYARDAIAEAAAGDVDCAALKGGAPVPESVAPRASPSIRAQPGIATVRVSWAPSPDDDVLGYRVERAPRAGGPWTRLTAEPVRSPFFDATVVNGRTYRYSVVPVDTVGNVGARSGAACATPTGELERYFPSRAALQADDGRRVVVRARARGGKWRASFDASVRRPACARVPKRLTAVLDARSSTAGVLARLEARNPATGRWVAVGSRRLGPVDRLLAGGVPPSFARASAVVRLRVVATGPARFAAGLDLLRLDVR